MVIRDVLNLHPITDLILHLGSMAAVKPGETKMDPRAPSLTVTSPGTVRLAPRMCNQTPILFTEGFVELLLCKNELNLQNHHENQSQHYYPSQ